MRCGVCEKEIDVEQPVACSNCYDCLIRGSIAESERHIRDQKKIAEIERLAANRSVYWKPCDNYNPRPAVKRLVLAVWYHPGTESRFVSESYFEDFPPRWEDVSNSFQEPEWEVVHWAELPEPPTVDTIEQG